MTRISCRLCRVEIDKDNKCDAHILPRGLLKVLSPDEFGQLLLVGTDMPKKRAPKGSYDDKILCRTCDNGLGDYDDYIAQFVQYEKLKDHPTGLGWIAEGFDQHNLKMFFISYLWRCSITNRSEFNRVSLGERHEAKMRQMLLDKSSGSSDEYTVVLSKFESAQKQVGGLLTPAKTRVNGIVYYQGYLPRLYQFWIKVDARPDPLLRPVGLGVNSDIFIHNKGNFDTSPEKGIMVRAVNYKGRRRS